MGKRLDDTRNSFQLPSHLRMENFAKYIDQGQATAVKAKKGGSGLAEFVKLHKDNNIDWSVIPNIKKVSGLPVFAKGVMCKEDARLALENGADGIYVSNHGARQLDTTPATIEVLREIVNEANLFSKETNTKRCEILFDGGIRTGVDVLKSLAIGADTVWIGRAVLWALTCEGRQGVENVIRILNEELKEAMLKCGVYSMKDIREKGESLLYKDDELIFPRL